MAHISPFETAEMRGQEIPTKVMFAAAGNRLREIALIKAPRFLLISVRTKEKGPARGGSFVLQRGTSNLLLRAGLGAVLGFDHFLHLSCRHGAVLEEFHGGRSAALGHEGLSQVAYRIQLHGHSSLVLFS